MSLSVDGTWKAGVWAATVWADGVWSEVQAVEEETQAKGGFWPSARVRPQKRHKKLDTFREYLESLVDRTEQVTKEPALIELKAQATEQIDAIVERFNIVQTFDDSGIITEQMALLRQDLQGITQLIGRLEREKAKAKIEAQQEKMFHDEQELIILILASEF